MTSNEGNQIFSWLENMPQKKNSYSIEREERSLVDYSVFAPSVGASFFRQTLLFFVSWFSVELLQIFKYAKHYDSICFVKFSEGSWKQRFGRQTV